jgi:hypothetical protein
MSRCEQLWDPLKGRGPMLEAPLHLGGEELPLPAIRHLYLRMAPGHVVESGLPLGVPTLWNSQTRACVPGAAHSAQTRCS